VLKSARRDSAQPSRALRGKTVIVGYVDFTPAQRDDHYPTVYTTTEGVKLSGSEILATAVANIASDSSVESLSVASRALVVAVFGLALASLLLVPAPVRGLVSGAGLCAGYLALALLLFRFKAVWLPVLVPLTVQAPIGILYAIAHHYRDMA